MDLTDTIYEAALLPDQWPAAMEGMAALSGAAEGSMLLFRDGAPPHLVGFNLDPATIEGFRQSWDKSPATQWGLRSARAEFLSFRDHVPAHLLESDPAVTLLVERGLDDQIVSVHPLEDGRALGFMFARRGVDGPFGAHDRAALNALRPHLVRAGLVAARLERERAHTMTATLDRLGLAAAVIDTASRVIAVNTAFEALPDMLIPTAFGGVALRDRVKDARFRDALARAGRGADGPAISIPVAADDAHPPMILHLLPICGQAQDIFISGHVLLVAVPVGRRGAPAPELLRGLFDLTAAEARLTHELMTGARLPGIAARTGLSVHTLRVQLRAVMAKTGTHRQAELMRLLAIAPDES